MNIGMLYSRIREEEKMLLNEFKNKNIDVKMIDDREIHLSLDNEEKHDYDAIIERSISHSRALYALKLFNSYGIPTINSYEVATICGDKALTSVELQKSGVRTPKTIVAFTPKSTLDAIEKLGYPVVIKPVAGSWGRLCAKINDREAAEAILEHKEVLGEYLHSIFYVQEYVDKPNRDIRAFVVGDETIAAIIRKSDHWMTNTSRGGVAENYPINDELNEICLQASKAVGGGVIAIDLMEAPEGLTVHEVNYTMEFRNSVNPTGVNIPEKIVDYVIGVAKK